MLIRGPPPKSVLSAKVPLATTSPTLLTTTLWPRDVGQGATEAFAPEVIAVGVVLREEDVVVVLFHAAQRASSEVQRVYGRAIVASFGGARIAVVGDVGRGDALVARRLFGGGLVATEGSAHQTSEHSHSQEGSRNLQGLLVVESRPGAGASYDFDLSRMEMAETNHLMRHAGVKRMYMHGCVACRALVTSSPHDTVDLTAIQLDRADSVKDFRLSYISAIQLDRANSVKDFRPSCIRAALQGASDRLVESARRGTSRSPPRARSSSSAGGSAHRAGSRSDRRYTSRGTHGLPSELTAASNATT